MKIRYLYQCENTICGNRIYIDTNKSDIKSLPKNCTCICHDNMVLVYEEIEESGEEECI